MLYPNQRNDGCARARTRQGGRACWDAYGRGGYGGAGVYAPCVWEGAVRVAASRCALRRRLRPAAHTDAPCRRVPARGSRSVRPCREAGNYVMLCYVMLCICNVNVHGRNVTRLASSVWPGNERAGISYTIVRESSLRTTCYVRNGHGRNGSYINASTVPSPPLNHVDSASLQDSTRLRS